jgi:hypothetical protein
MKLYVVPFGLTALKAKTTFAGQMCQCNILDKMSQFELDTWNA